MSMLKSLSRLLLSGTFISGGADAFLKPGGRVNKVAAFDIPEAEKAVKLNGTAMVLAGTALALDIAPKAAATILICCLIPTTIVGHPFWKEEDSGSRKNHQVQFLKNLGLMGGLLLVLLEKK